MKITIVSGSHRNASQSEKVARHIETQIKDSLRADTFLINLANNPLPLWEEAIWDGDAQWEDRLNPYRKELLESDALVVVTPEYHGQVPAGLKNFFLLFGKKELGHKAGLIVALSSTDGGSYCIAELRMSSYKNSRLCYIPEHLIIRNVEKVLNSDASQNDETSDAYFKERITWNLQLLSEYAKALKAVRASGLTEHEMFPSGM